MLSSNLHSKINQLEVRTSKTLSDLSQNIVDIDLIDFISQSIKDIGQFGNINITDELISEIEGLTCLLLTVSGCKDLTSTTAAILLYVRKFFPTSMSAQLVSYISETFVSQSGETLEVPQWLSLIRNARENWALCKGNKLFGHFSKLLGLVVTLGLCKASSLTFEINGYKLFEPDLKLVHGSANDIADAALNTVTFFVESMYMCFKNRSLRPFLIGNQQAVEIDEEFVNVLSFWNLVQTGNLERVKGISDAEFDRRLESITNEIKNLMNTKTAFEKKIFTDKFNKLVDIRNDYTTLKISSGVRRAPFAIELFGESSQGKTTIGDQIVDALLTSANLPLGKEYRASYNPADKFMSNWTTDKTVMFIDDMANDKPDFVERPPTRTIIDLCNNQPYYANMADLTKKGKVFVEPEIVMVNTNVKDLDARKYSNCPYSIQRRMHAVITVTAKREFQRIDSNGITCGIDAAKIKAFNKANGGETTFDDIWILTVSQAVKPQLLTTGAKYEPIEWNGQLLEDVSFQVVLNYLIEKFQEHREDQYDIIDRMSSRTRKIERCGIDGCCQMKYYCLKHPIEKQFGEEIERSFYKASSILTNKLNNDVSYASRCVEGATTLAMMTAARYIVYRWDWISFIPSQLLLNNTCFNAFLLLNKDMLKRAYMVRTLLVWFTFIITLFYTYRTPYVVLLIPLFMLFISYQYHLYDQVISNYRQKLLTRNTIAPAIQRVRDQHAQSVCAGAAIIGMLYAFAKIYRRWRAFQNHGSLEPKTQEEIEFRDKQVNPFISISKRSIIPTDKQLTTSYNRLGSLVEKNLVYGTVIVGERTLMVNGLFLRSNVVLIPNHYFEKDVLDITFRKANPDTCGGKFASRITRACSYRIPQTDLCVCYSSTGGSFRDLTPYLPEGTLGTFQFMMHYRAKSGEIIKAEGVATEQYTSNGECGFLGGVYENLQINTFSGLCGAVLVSAGKANVIAGFHLGGVSGRPKGCYGKLSRAQVIEACDKLRIVPGVLLTGTAERFEKQVLGVNVLNDKPLHPKSPLHYLPKDSQLEYYGSCPGESSSISQVRVLPISEVVMDVMGQPNIWGPPKMKPEWFGWQKCLENMSVPAIPYPHELLILAVEDYKSALIPIFQSKLWRNSRPLTDHENLCGKPGVRFIDSIQLSTSIGFPLTGSKRRFVTELEATEEKPNNRVLDPIVMEEISRCENCYRRGERAFTIAKACKKDEILAKEKCRIFYGNPISFTYLMRKYYLPLLRVLQMNPLVSECAVGINKDGPEWEQFHNHVTRHGMDSLIGGDYGKYDQKLPSQLIIAGLRILIDFAKECDYSDEDLKVMEAMAGDLAYSLIAFNGDLVGLTEGSHISGNSLTAVLNGICGSLNLRAVFYTQYAPESFEERINFRDAVALMTYGDDNIGSVNRVYDQFTIKNISKFLEQHGQTYTMPDKESELLDYLPEKEFEFLKCSSVYHPKLGVHLGALAEKSIFKSLHCYLHSKVEDLTVEMRCADNIDDALRKYFTHGEKVYESKRPQLVEVAKRGGVAHLCRELDMSYDDRVKLWYEKYDSEISFTKQSGEELKLEFLPVQNVYIDSMLDLGQLSISDSLSVTTDRTPEDLYVKAIRDIPLKVIARDKTIVNSAIGEVDLVFQHTVFGLVNFVYVEIKQTTFRTSTKSNARRKGRKQMDRLIKAMGVLNPKVSHIGLLLDRDGYHLINTSGPPNTLPLEALPLRVD